MADRKMGMGVACYRREEYMLLRALASDPEDMACTYEQWMIGAEKLLAELAEKGLLAQKVDVGIKELAAWCEEQDRPIDGKARSEYAAQKLRRGFVASAIYPDDAKAEENHGKPG